MGMKFLKGLLIAIFLYMTLIIGLAFPAIGAAMSDHPDKEAIIQTSKDTIKKFLFLD